MNGLAALGSAVLATVAWRRCRTGVTAAGLAVAMIAVSVWAALDCVIAFSLVRRLSPGFGHAAAMAMVPVSSIMVAGFWWLCRALLSPGWRITPRKILICLVEPAIMTGAAATNPSLHALFRFPTTMPADPWLRMQPQWLFWGHTLLLYAGLATILATLVRGIRNAGHLQRRQARWILLGALVPIAVNAVTLRTAGDLPDLTALAFVITSLFIFHAVFREGLLRVIPVARSLVFDRLQDAVIVTDAEGRLVDLNRAGSKLIEEAAPHLPRRPGVALGPTLDALGLPEQMVDGEYRVQLPHGPRVFDVRVERILDHRARLTANVALVRDITELAEQRDVLECSNQQLREQLDTIEALRGKLAEQASRDELTGLYNRRHLIAAMKHHIYAAAPGATDMCAVLLDVDFFKSVNDRHGHMVGDDLLRGIAGALAAAVAEPAMVARYGGEEFVAVLPGADLSAARAWADDVRRRCAAVVVPSAEGPVSRTVSMGVSPASISSALVGTTPANRSTLLLSWKQRMPPCIEPRPTDATRSSALIQRTPGTSWVDCSAEPAIKPRGCKSASVGVVLAAIGSPRKPVGVTSGHHRVVGQLDRRVRRYRRVGTAAWVLVLWARVHDSAANAPSTTPNTTWFEQLPKHADIFG